MVMLPLRLFLGGTYVFAGLQKLADPNYLRASAPSSVQSQMRGAEASSPVHALVTTASHHAVLVGLLIAIGELAVGVGMVLGLWTRAAAAGGMGLALSFLLTVSWHSRPYYLGSDIVFLMAFLPFALAGARDGLAVDAVVQRIGRRRLGLAPAEEVSIDFATVRRLCGAYDAGSCRLRSDRVCDPAGCPVLGFGLDRRQRDAVDLDRRSFLASARLAAAVSAAALSAGGLAAILGRVVGGTRGGSAHTTRLRSGVGNQGRSQPGQPATTPPPGPTSRPAGPSSRPNDNHQPSTAPPPSGTSVGDASAVPVGGAGSFIDPATGSEAIVIRPSADRFVAYSAVCTHQGCRVDWSQSQQVLRCPCHGAVFDAKDGSVLQGPAPSPLPPISIEKGADGRLYVG